MKITDVRTMRLIGPDPHGIGGTTRMWSIRLVRIDTDAGMYGLGEAADFPGVTELIGRAREWLIGRGPESIGLFVRSMLYGGLPPYRPQMSPTATVTGPAAWMVSGIEMALCDLMGKAHGLPVYDLLGGGLRDRVKVYLDRSGVADPTDDTAWRALAERTVNEGFRDLKFDAEWIAPELTGDPFNRNARHQQVAKIASRLQLVRETVGPDIEILLDCHMSYDVESAIRLADAVADLDLTWLEDPLPALDLLGLADVRSQVRIPICAGETFVADQFRQAIGLGSVDIVHPDVLFVGGLHEARKVADLADLHAIPLALHNNGSALATVAAAHVAAASPNFLGLEYHFYDADWIGNVVRRDVDLFDNGAVPLTDAPGLGIELNEDVCRAHLAPGASLF